MIQVLEEIKKGLFLQSEKIKRNNIKSHRNEKNISTIEQEKKEQARVQGKNVISQRAQNFESPPGKRQKKIVGFR